MIQTIPLYNILAKWKDTLKNNHAIQDFCQENFGKSPKFFVGLNLEDRPTAKDCPLIIIRPGSKEEGELDKFTYALTVSWSIINENKTVTGNVIEFDGIKQCDNLGQLILQALCEANPNYPVTKITFDENPIDYFPMHHGEMTLETEVPVTLGGTLSY